MRSDNERGATALIVAFALLFIMGAAAMAVDVSGFYGTARVDQKTADLACLAGVAELPDDTAALNMAATYAELNWPGMSGVPLTVLTAQTAVMNDGNGNTIQFETRYGGEDDQMRVTVSEAADTRFGRVLGAQSVQVTQEAVCSKASGGGKGSLPFGVLPGGFGGGIFGPNPCGLNTGNCGALDIPIDGLGGGADTTEENIATGAQRTLIAHRGDEGTDYWNPEIDGWINTVECGDVSDGDECSVTETKTGVNAGKLGEGFRRLLATADPSCTEVVKGVTLDCDTPGDILPGGGTTMVLANGGQPPTNWLDGFGDLAGFESVFGAIGGLDWIYYDDVDVQCDSPRLATMPVVSADLDWDLLDGNPGWPAGKKDVKIVAMLNVIITEPYFASDFEPGGALKHAAVKVVWFGPNAMCDGTDQPIGVYNGVPYTPGQQGVKLVAP